MFCCVVLTFQIENKPPPPTPKLGDDFCVGGQAAVLRLRGAQQGVGALRRAWVYSSSLSGFRGGVLLTRTLFFILTYGNVDPLAKILVISYASRQGTLPRGYLRAPCYLLKCSRGQLGFLRQSWLFISPVTCWPCNPGSLIT